MPQYIIGPKTGHRRLISKTICTGNDFYPINVMFNESAPSKDKENEIKKAVKYHKRLYKETGNSYTHGLLSTLWIKQTQRLLDGFLSICFHVLGGH